VVGSRHMRRLHRSNAGESQLLPVSVSPKPEPGGGDQDGAGAGSAAGAAGAGAGARFFAGALRLGAAFLATFRLAADFAVLFFPRAGAAFFFFLLVFFLAFDLFAMIVLPID
jgi:hypothetical protein